MLNKKSYWTSFALNCSTGNLRFSWTSLLSLGNCHFECRNINQGRQLRQLLYRDSPQDFEENFPLSFSCHKPLARSQCISRTGFLIPSVLLLCLCTCVKNKHSICTCECKRLPEHVKTIHKQYGGVVRSTNTESKLPVFEFQLCHLLLTLGRLFNLCVLQFPHLQKENKKRYLPIITFYYFDRYLAHTGVCIYQNRENIHLRLCITLN